MTTEERDALETILRTNLRKKSQELQELWNSVNDHWGYEDAIYRFYSQSFKVYSLQKTTIRIVELLQSLVPGRELNPWFSRIVQDGTGKQFTMADNARWLEATRPIVEAFLSYADFLVLDRKLTLSLQPVVPTPHGYAAYWPLRRDSRAVIDLTLGVLLAEPAQLRILGYIVLPKWIQTDRSIRVCCSSQNIELLGHRNLDFLTALIR